MDISRRTVLTSLAAALTLPLTGCTEQLSGESSTRASPGTASAPISGPESPPVPETVPVTIGVPSLPRTLDPALTVDAESHRSTRQVLETLLGVDPDTGAPVPQLASDWHVTEDGLRYTFTLEPDIVFQDGTALTAQVVAANFQRWAHLPELLGAERMDALPHLPFASVFGGYAGQDRCRYVDCVPIGERTVTLELSDPIVFLPAALTSPPFALSSPSSWSVFDEALPGTAPDSLPPSRPAGTGPFRWGEPDDGRRLVLEVNPEYRGELSGVGPVTLAVVHGARERLRDLRRARLDAFEYVTPDTLRPLVQGGAQVLQRDPLAVLYLGMNSLHPVLRHLYVRQAAAHAVDRRALAEEYFLAGSSVAHEFVPPSLGVEHPELTTYDYDPAQATRLLALAGYQGEPLNFMYPVQTSRAYLGSPEEVYARIAGDLATAGFVLNPVPVPWDDGYLERLGNDPERAFHLAGRTGEYRDPHHFLGPLFGHASDEFGYLNRTVIQTLRTAVSTAVPETRTTLYRRAAESIALDLPALPLVYPISAVATGHTLVYYPTSPVLDERFDQIVPVHQAGSTR